MKFLAVAAIVLSFNSFSTEIHVSPGSSTIIKPEDQKVTVLCEGSKTNKCYIYRGIYSDTNRVYFAVSNENGKAISTHSDVSWAEVKLLKLREMKICD